MRDSHDTVAPTGTTTATCRACGHTLANREYYCPECNTPHFPHLKASLGGPSLKFLAFFLVVAGPVAAYTFYEAVIRFAGRI